MTDTGVVLLLVGLVSCMDAVWCRWALASRDRSFQNSTRVYTADRVTFEATLLRLGEKLDAAEKDRGALFGQLNRQWAYQPNPTSEVESSDA